MASLPSNAGGNKRRVSYFYDGELCDHVKWVGLFSAARHVFAVVHGVSTEFAVLLWVKGQASCFLSRVAARPSHLHHTTGSSDGLTLIQPQALGVCSSLKHLNLNGVVWWIVTMLVPTTAACVL